MHRQTFEELEAALSKLGAELAEKSSEGTLTPAERREYEEIVALDERLSLARLQAQAFWARSMNAAS